MKNTKTVKLTGILMSLLIMGVVFVSITYSSQGSQLIAIEKEIAMIEEESREIKADIVRNSSLSKISEEVEKLEMEVPENIVYVSSEKLVLSYK